MNKIVHEHLKASELPEKLRGGIDASAIVTVTVEEEWDRPARVMTLEEIFAARQPPFRTSEEIDADVRTRRDEWDG